MTPNRQKFATAMAHYPQLALYKSGSTTPETYLTESNPPDTTFSLERYKEGKVIEYVSHLDVTNNKIYLLYEGIPEKKTRGKHSSYIQVLNWNGEPIEHYFIPSK
jgi:predicted aconitase